MRQCAVVEDLRPLRVRQGDDLLRAQPSEAAAHRLDGRPEVVGNVAAAHRQRDAVVGDAVLTPFYRARRIGEGVRWPASGG
jgi:hypothetical protein